MNVNLWMALKSNHCC